VQNVESFFQVAIMSSCVFIAHLPQPSPGKLKVSTGCFLGLLDEGVEDHNSMANRGAEKRSANPFFAFGAHLKQSYPHWASKRHPKMGTEYLHPFGDPCIYSANANRPHFNVLPDGLTVILDLPWHTERLTILLIFCQPEEKPNARRELRLEADAERTL
jgi:hypothetical protein